MAASGITGRIIIVTGGGGGIGRGLVRHFVRNGARVVIAELKPELVEAAVAELEGDGRSVLGVVCDVGKRDSIEAMVAKTVDHFGGVDALVNNAMTFTPNTPIAELSDEDWDVNMATGPQGTLWAMQAVYPHMKRAGWGRIVNVGSSAGLIGFKGYAAYSAAKEATRALTRVAAREWFAEGIVVNLYCPVSIGVRSDRDMSVHDPATAPNPLGQMAMNVLATLSPAAFSGDPERDLAPTVAFLCSDECRYLTGNTLTLDGGAYAFA